MENLQVSVCRERYTVRLVSPLDGPIQCVPNEVLSIDTETELIVQGRPTRLALLQVCYRSKNQIDLVEAAYAEGYLKDLYRMHPKAIYVFQNAAFDLSVLDLRNPSNAPLLCAVDTGRVVDIGLRYQLWRLSRVGDATMRSLDFMAKKLLGFTMDKSEDIRLTFRPGMALTERHIRYAAVDAAVTLQIYQALPRPMPTEWTQLVGSIALRDMEIRGIAVDRPYMERLHEEYTARAELYKETLSVFGFRPGVPGNKKVLQEILAHIEQVLQRMDNDKSLLFSRTPKSGDIQVTDESMDVMGSHSHLFLDSYRDFQHANKYLQTYLDPKFIAVDGRVHSHYSTLVRSGRTSSAAPNIQNLPQKENIRGIYVARPGHVLYAVDYSQLELCTLAETCLSWFGKSQMANVINEGHDLHTWFAARILRKDQDSVTKDERKMAKAANFGFPGGMGIRTFIASAKKSYDVHLTEDQATELREEWLRAFPEIGHYFDSIQESTSNIQGDGSWYVGKTITGRIREKCGFCSACNASFQGLAADGAKIALYLLWKESFPNVAFIHDEVVQELRVDGDLQDRLNRADVLMKRGMAAVVKHVPVQVEGVLMQRWDKAAAPVYDEKGRLCVWHGADE